MTKLAYAVHECHFRKKGDKNDTVAPAKGLFRCPDGAYDDFLKLGAIREPTEDEHALFDLTQSKSDDTDDQAAADQAAADQAAADEQTAADQAAADEQTAADQATAKAKKGGKKSSVEDALG